MNKTLLNFWLKFQNLVSKDGGQDLVEYALIIALLSLAAVATMQGLASGIVSAFSNITTTLNTATS